LPGKPGGRIVTSYISRIGSGHFGVIIGSS
jgi:hypothetical protein